MCSICTTSQGPDRYGPVYGTMFAVQSKAPARMPWLEPKVDPNCPGCRVGAYLPGEPLPPMPNGQAGAGQAMVPGTFYGPGLVSYPPYGINAFPTRPVPIGYGYSTVLGNTAAMYWPNPLGF